MANSKQAAKRAKQALKRRNANMSLRTALRTAVKKIEKAISAGDSTGAQAALRAESSNIDRIARKGIVHRNKAARHKSRLAARAKALEPRT